MVSPSPGCRLDSGSRGRASPWGSSWPSGISPCSTPGQPQSNFSFVPFLLTLIPARILFGWIYNVTGGSVLLAVLLHASGNAWSEILPLGPTALETAWPEMIVFAIAAVIVVLKHRGPVPPGREIGNLT